MTRPAEPAREAAQGVQRVTVAPEADGQRLDRWFQQRFPDLGHARLQRLLRTGQIRVDGRRAKGSLRLSAGQEIRVPPIPVKDSVASAEPRTSHASGGQTAVSAAEAVALQARVLHRDDWLLALNKPAGLAVQGGSGQKRHLDALLDALRFGAQERPRLVHRLDKDTSGVLLLARNLRAARALTEAFRTKETQKLYWALVAGNPRRREGLIDLPLIKKSAGGDRERMQPDADAGQSAQTFYRVVAAGKRASWLVLMPVTGRTHQIRVHCAALGTPILGDGKYGGRGAFLPDRPASAKLGGRPDWPTRLQLHALEIALPHPEDGTTLRIRAPLPEHMAKAFERLGFDADKGDGAVDALLGYAEPRLRQL